MGNSEKLAILLLVFAGILVLTIPFGDGDDATPAATDPFTLAQELAKEVEPPVPDPAPGASADPGAERDPASGAVRASAPAEPLAARSGAEAEGAPAPGELLLDASRKTGVDPDPEAAAAQRILQTTRGLRPSKSSDFMEYRVRDGDTWSGLAQRFYRDGKYTRNLHLANEGLSELRAGNSILVPVFDLLATSGERAPFKPARTLPASAERGAAVAASARPPVRPSIYEVQSGDSLSKISLEVYGTATRWQDIFEANRDKLESAHWLEVGMKLAIPDIDLSKPPAKSKRTESAPSKKTDKMVD